LIQKPEDIWEVFAQLSNCNNSSRMTPFRRILRRSSF
jgi:hypothetical protein